MTTEQRDYLDSLLKILGSCDAANQPTAELLAAIQDAMRGPASDVEARVAALEESMASVETAINLRTREF